MRALARRAWGEGVPDCSKCKRDEGIAQEFGCREEPALRSMYEITCSVCGGIGCERCERRDTAPPRMDDYIPAGDGTMGVRRCPAKLGIGHDDVSRAFRAFIYYDEHGTLPVAGGLHEQSAALVASFDIVRAEKIAIENERVKKQERDAKRQQMAAKRG